MEYDINDPELPEEGGKKQWTPPRLIDLDSGIESCKADGGISVDSVISTS